MTLRNGIFTGTAFLAALLIAACASNEVHEAFDPAMDARSSDKLITKYCTSCHTHKDFDGTSHVLNAQTKYAGGELAGAVECRTCHTYKETWMGDEVRGTHWPPPQQP